ncbi:hypothetical protein EUX98_g9185 [Antrodiella citrinella]|uniref:L-type lectin-like domain-containing protein n=1 Tax=Antrodiella citrinella TaxID=2447956 RepID=A0A4S4LX83_9APHY|nr:hypothetical protein EUX98_g9185 [Antrodiella citrinella]
MLLGGLLAFLSLGLAPTGVWGARDEKLANKTIDRTVSLRTHSIYAPYIDQDLQNRWWDFGGDAYVPGPVFGSIDNFNGVGVFLDTYANARHSYAFPRVVGMKGDGKTAYDMDHDGDANSIGACSANYRRTNVATKLKVTYIKESYLDVKIQYKAWDEWSDCFTVHGADVLPVAPFLGFSAMTGDVFDNHDIISITTYSAVLSSPQNQRDKLAGAKGGKMDVQESSYVMKAARFFVLIGMLLCMLYGAKAYYRRRQRQMGGMGGGMPTPGFQGSFYQDSKRF